MDIIIVGIGQSLRGDDSAGLTAVQSWRKSFPRNASLSNLRIELAELPGLSLLDQILRTDAAIIVDAVCSGAQPGTIHLVSETDLIAFETNNGSAHGMGVAETIVLGRRIYPQEMPAELILIGIEASDFKLGAKLSSKVRKSIPLAAKSIETQLQSLLNREIRE